MGLSHRGEIPTTRYWIYIMSMSSGSFFRPVFSQKTEGSNRRPKPKSPAGGFYRRVYRVPQTRRERQCPEAGGRKRPELHFRVVRREYSRPGLRSEAFYNSQNPYTSMNMHVASPSEPAVREPRVELLTRAAFHGTYTTGLPQIFKFTVFGANTGLKSCHAEGEDVGSCDGDPSRAATMSSKSMFWNRDGGLGYFATISSGCPSSSRSVSMSCDGSSGSVLTCRDGDPRRSATMSDVGRRPYRWWKARACITENDAWGKRMQSIDDRIFFSSAR